MLTIVIRGVATAGGYIGQNNHIKIFYGRLIWGVYIPIYPVATPLVLPRFIWNCRKCKQRPE